MSNMMSTCFFFFFFFSTTLTIFDIREVAKSRELALAAKKNRCCAFSSTTGSYGVATGSHPPAADETAPFAAPQNCPGASEAGAAKKKMKPMKLELL